MTTLREAAQQALEALKCLVETHEMGNTIRADIMDAEEAIASLKAALEQPEQEPVAWVHAKHLQGLTLGLYGYAEIYTDESLGRIPVYTHPPRREWRGLSEEETAQVLGFGDYTARSTEVTLTVIARAIEAALRSKNHD